ncbi:MAG: type II toxin-antitoxin system VapC family toxin [bacterium]
MKKLKLYIETSVWNFLFADDAPEKKRDTQRFFEEVRSADYELFISELVIAEIQRASLSVSERLMRKIEEFMPETLEITDEIRELTYMYANSNLLPEKAFDDLAHVAVASVNNMDFLVSWNLKHIVKVKTIMGINAVNVFEGYKELKICDVLGVFSDE